MATFFISSAVAIVFPPFPFILNLPQDRVSAQATLSTVLLPALDGDLPMAPE
jgi:hypothetical protein